MIDTNPCTRVVFPAPGPPVIIEIGVCNAILMASICSSDNSTLSEVLISLASKIFRLILDLEALEILFNSSIKFSSRSAASSVEIIAFSLRVPTKKREELSSKTFSTVFISTANNSATCWNIISVGTQVCFLSFSIFSSRYSVAARIRCCSEIEILSRLNIFSRSRKERPLIFWIRENG